MSTIQWPPRRAGCQGDCNQGRSTCDCGLNRREGLQRVDTLRDRADTDPSLPIGQDEPSEPRKVGREALDWIGRHFGVISLIVAVLAVVGAMLVVHFRAPAQTEPVHVPVVSIKGMV